MQQKVIDKNNFTKAADLRGISGYINSDPSISIASLHGKVVLVDFWTYSCINCIRTQPYLNDWHKKYSDKGLVIIGVHTPEFEFEKDYENVKLAVEKNGIKYPVVLDNDYSTWRAYQNNYWPRKYLIDADGYIRYDHIGEGRYEETEDKIVELLNERDAALKLKNEDELGFATPQFSKIGSPELYLGYDFARVPLGNSEGFLPEQTVSYKLPQSFIANLVYLEGEWENKNDFAKLVSEKGKVALIFNAKNVNIVAGNMEQKGSKLKIFIDGKESNFSNKGLDAVFDSNGFVVPVSGQKLYNIVSLPDYGIGALIFEVEGSGFELYTFTFG